MAKEMEPKTLYDTLESIYEFRAKYGYPKIVGPVPEYVLKEHISRLESIASLSVSDLIKFKKYASEKDLEDKTKELKEGIKKDYVGRLEVINNEYMSYLPGKILEGIKPLCSTDEAYHKIEGLLIRIFEDFAREEMKRDLPDA
ncbi:MAG: hypothetical protein KJ767_02625 [Nanoarchaeota archaeon]|nr:hypothetical protein [Nanoarchaeota archaeon]